MLRINHISLVQFRNYGQSAFNFPNKVTGFCGSNGSGKTNLLDAIYYLCFTKSYFGKTDAQNMQFGKQGFRLRGGFTVNGQDYDTTCVVRENGKKEFGVNNEIYGRMAQHIGKFPCVMIAPDDVNIIMDGSEERRKFIDYTLSQLDAAYLQVLIDYNKILQQRNSLLKQAAESGRLDEPLLDIYSDQLVTAGKQIFAKRTRFLENFIPIANALYEDIAGTSEKLSIKYTSSLQSDSFENILKQNRHRDLALQRTSQGVHRDDLEFGLNGEVFKSTASQGQRKSLLFSLKLAEFEVLLKAKQFAPILLLDDVFEKLDEQRMRNLLARVCVANKGQVFISDTHPQRLQAALQELDVDHTVIELQ